MSSPSPEPLFPASSSQSDHPMETNMADESRMDRTNQSRSSSSSPSVLYATESSKKETTCPVCRKASSPSEMITHKRDGEEHTFCASCLVFNLLTEGCLPFCMICGGALEEEDYREALSPSMLQVAHMLREEMAIPVRERVYCAYRSCSALHSKAEAGLPREEVSKFDYNASGIAERKKCKHRFCMSCGVAWHDSVSCGEYRRTELAKQREEEDLQQWVR